MLILPSVNCLNNREKQKIKTFPTEKTTFLLFNEEEQSEFDKTFIAMLLKVRRTIYDAVNTRRN
jgi:hypothetical protein